MDTSYCQVHNEPIIFLETNTSNSPQKGLCRVCVQSKMNNLQLFEYNDNEKAKALEFIKYSAEQTIKSLKQLIDDLYDYQQFIYEQFDAILISIEEEIKITQEIRSTYFYLFQLNDQLNQNLNVYDCSQKLNDRNQKIFDSINLQLQNLEKEIKFESFFTFIQQLGQKSLPQKKQPQNTDNDNVYQYNLINYQRESDNLINSKAIAFDETQNLIFLGSQNNILVYEFQQRYIKFSEQIKGHTAPINCLYYMKKKQQLISASDDFSIFVWIFKNKSKHLEYQIKNAHRKEIYSLISNAEEDLIISGGNDRTINFFMKEKEYNLTQSIQTTFKVNALSMDHESNKIIACGFNEPIIIVIKQIKQKQQQQQKQQHQQNQQYQQFQQYYYQQQQYQQQQQQQQEQQQQQQWVIAQTINTQYYGIRLCFINSYQFVFSSNWEEKLEVYEFNKKVKEFIKAQEIQIKGCKDENILFPCQFIKSSGILIVKNNRFINILKRLENGTFNLKQSIEFNNGEFYGRATDEGDFLLIWDQKSRSIAVREFEQYNKQQYITKDSKLRQQQCQVF